ncbi:MAG TPA: translocase [Candidatus Nitrosopelagicus sp.]|jgi:sec-independent protein translocase protein TatA|nr:translocase [Candidatus Nitrosopelagicus sp.]
MFESLMLFVGGTEIIILVVVIGVLIFGAAKIPQLAKTFGKAKSEYKKGEIEGDKELKEFKENKNDEKS